MIAVVKMSKFIIGTYKNSSKFNNYTNFIMKIQMEFLIGSKVQNVTISSNYDK